MAVKLGTVIALIEAMAPKISPEVIEAAVSDWLDDHPEAAESKSITTKKQRKPLMTFIDDDSCIEFASIWPAICEEKGIKVSCAVISDAVGDSSHLSWDQIEQMHNDGIVEFVNHTDAQENLAGIDPEEAYARVKKCKDALASHGIKTGDILVYPYGTYDESAIDAFKGICRCGITTDKGTEVTWNEPPVRTFALWRNELVESNASANPSLEWMKSVVDKAVEKNAWVIWMSHSQYAGFDASAIANIKSLIDYAREKNVDIVTAGEALDLFANAYEVGRYQFNGMAGGFSIGCDGTTYGRGANFETVPNTYSFHKPIESYPINSIIANNISGVGAAGFPMDGLLISFIAPTTAYEYRNNSYQIFKVSSKTKLSIYERGFAEDGLPNDFHLKTPRAGESSERPLTADIGYVYYDTTLGKPIFASVGAQRAWYKLEITKGTTSAGTTKFAGTSVELEAGMTKEEVRDAVANALCPLRESSPLPGLMYYTPKELGFEDDGVSLYCMRSAFVDYTMNLWVDPVQPDTACRGTYTRLRDGVATKWVDATGATV